MTEVAQNKGPADATVVRTDGAHSIHHVLEEMKTRGFMSGASPPLMKPLVFIFLSQWPLSGMSLFTDTCLPSPLVSPSHLLLCGVELFVFRGLFMGEGIPRCSGPPLVFQLIRQNMTALPLFGAEMSCFSRYRRETNFSASSSPATWLPDSGSILYARANTGCVRTSA